MSEYRISLADRYTSVFGIVAKNVIPALGNIGISKSVYGLIAKPERMDPANAEARDTATSYGELEVLPPDEESELANDLGNPMWDILELENPDLPDGRFRFLYPVMITPGRDPNIATTIVNQNFEAGIQPGEVVESFGWSPWRIRIRGLLVDMENHQFPTAMIGQLHRALRINDTYRVNNQLLNELDITEVYMSAGIEFIPAREYKDTVEFQLTLSSHEPVEALILNSN